MNSRREKRLGKAVASGRKTKALPDVRSVSIDTELFRWSAQDIDHDFEGQWDWHLDAKEARDILDLLAQTSKLTWREVKDLKTNSKSKTRPLHHGQSIDTICPDAQRRLDQLEIGVDELFRLRHGNLSRLWGHLTGPVFNIVWWDRHHKVCPVD
ncbi:hypothetical protein IU501_10775 [Nocardia otitidiscaviarum]|uniref:hypothetical protein n=1 Tax=Nocardia otitidiscaviarum TaxID=1823 RepID=UPI001893A9C5|nr:hypothetical protein [Nocardia otitidiscaviarum]MBF6133482.1 hypothetical protein [Nocardia otitidiscaviarum]